MFLYIFFGFLFKAANGCDIQNICEGQTATFTCSSGLLHIVSATYGITESVSCSKVSLSSPCYVDLKGYVQSSCEGKASCSFKADATLGDPCRGYGKFTSICYDCISPMRATCFQQNTDQGGTELYFLTVASDFACQLLCQRTDFCQFFVYTAGTSVCQLKYLSTGTTSSNGKTTGSKFCPGPCFESTSMVPTAVSPVLTNIDNAFLCQLQCQRKGDCNQFIYDANGKNCYLKPLNTGTSITVTNATIGPKSCGYNSFQASCHWENIDVNLGSLRAYSNIFSSLDCQAICASQSDCYYFVFDKISFNCHMKGASFSAAYNTRFTAGPKICSDVLAGFDYNVNYPGNDLYQFFNEPSIVDCQTRCLNYNGCTYFTYRSTDKVCFLKTGMPRQGVSSHHSGPKMEYYYPDSCMIDNINYGGYDIRDFNVGNNYECQYHCQAEPACNFFLVLKSGTNENSGIAHCWLKFFYGQTNWHPNYMGGTRNCNQFKDYCFYNFVDIGCSNNIISFQTSSAFHCQYECQKNAACMAFSFGTTSRRCYLKDSVGCNRTHTSAISGPKTCGYMADACFKDNVVSAGTIMSTTPKFMSPYHCQFKCNRTLGCIGFNYHKWYSQCILLSDVTTTSVDPYYMSGLLTDCDGTIGSCFWDNLNSDGHDIYTVISNVPDMFTCQYKCKLDSNCDYFTHGKLDSNCFLKKGNGTLFADPLSISGPKDCSAMLAERCYEDYVYQPGLIITIQPLIPIVHYCQMACQNNPTCNFFNYNKVTWDCELLSQTSGAVATVNPIYTTGPKLCGQSTGIGALYRAIQLTNVIPYNFSSHSTTALNAVECAAKCNADFLATSSCTAFILSGNLCQLFIIGPFEYQLIPYHFNVSQKSLIRQHLFTTN